MEEGVTKEQLSRKVWLVGHSYPAEWVDKLNGPLDPRHPTRHNIWTAVLDRLQERVYSDGNRLRLDIEKCFICNAAAKQAKRYDKPDWDWVGKSIPGRIKLFSELLSEHKPSVVVTFGADAYRFAIKALGCSDTPPGKLKAAELGEGFRNAIDNWDPKKVNIFPLLHAYVARSGWNTAGGAYSWNGEENNANYFDIVGGALGDILLAHQELPIWCD
jgi:hypothetical protein